VAAQLPPPAPAQVEVEGIIIAVDPTAGTITVRDDDGPTTVVSVSAAGTYHVGQEVKVIGIPTGPGGSAATVQAQYVTLDDDGPEAPESALAAPGTTIKVEGRITAVNAAAGTITVQDDDGPATVVALGAARGPFYVWQEVEVYGTVTSAGSNGATVQAQFIRVKGLDGDDGDNDGGDNDDD
jgi:hypothetical protein